MAANASQSRGLVRSLIVLPLLIVATAVGTLQAVAAEIRVAVASNFLDAMADIAARFEEKTGHSVKLIAGSTGKHYAQISNGAPFDVFFAADARRPELLEHAGLAEAGSRFTYAVGKLVLWSPRSDYVDAQGVVLEQGGFRLLQSFDGRRERHQLYEIAADPLEADDLARDPAHADTRDRLVSQLTERTPAWPPREPMFTMLPLSFLR